MTVAITVAVCALLIGALPTFSSAQAGSALSPASLPVQPVNLPATSALPPHTRIGKYTVEEWRERIDTLWGAGEATSEKLRIFELAWNELDREYGAYMNLDVDMDALRSKYRHEISDGVSKGRFAAIMNYLGFAMRDAHTYLVNMSVNVNTYVGIGTPLLVIGAWSDNASFGASLTPMPDGSLLVYRVLPNHVLGLEPGDLVLGYDGVPWRKLYRQLLELEMPIRLRFTWGSTESSLEHSMLISAGKNWHLFDTIDIKKYGTDEIVSMPTDLLANQRTTIWGNEQLPVPGVEMPDFINEDWITWGVIDGTRIGYIYVASWHWEDQYRISEQWYEALDELMHHHETDGLIIDFRLNYGGYMLEAHDGYWLLFNERIEQFSFDLRGSPDDHLDMVQHPTYNARHFAIVGGPTTFYDKPIAVLIGPGAVSNGDWESLRIGYHPRFAHSANRPTALSRSPTSRTSGTIGISARPPAADIWSTGTFISPIPVSNPTPGCGWNATMSPRGGTRWSKLQRGGSKDDALGGLEVEHSPSCHFDEVDHDEGTITTLKGSELDEETRWSAQDSQNSGSWLRNDCSRSRSSRYLDRFRDLPGHPAGEALRTPPVPFPGKERALPRALRRKSRTVAGGLGNPNGGHLLGPDLCPRPWTG